MLKGEKVGRNKGAGTCHLILCQDTANHLTRIGLSASRGSKPNKTEQIVLYMG